MRDDLLVKTGRALRIASAAAVLVALTCGQVNAQSRRQSRDNTIAVAVTPGVAASTVHNGPDELVRGHQSMADGSLAVAEDHYRNAWQDPSVRPEAAEALQRLYAKPGYALKADETAVRRNFRALNNISRAFRRFDTEHFVLISDSGEEWTLERGKLLERAREQYFRVAQKMKLPVFPHRYKLVCILFDDHADYQAFAKAEDGLEARWVAGYYATGSNRVVFYNDATSPAYSAVHRRISAYEQELQEKRELASEAARRNQKNKQRQLLSSAEELQTRIQQERERIGKRAAAYSTAKTVHEAVHLLAFNTGMQLGDRDYPFWLSEGLATSFETDNATLSFGPDRALSAGTRKQRYEDLRRTDRLQPLRELVGMTEAPVNDAQAAEGMYSQSYALFHHLFKTDPEAIGRYMNALMQEPAGRISNDRHVELFESYFGAPESVQSRMAGDTALAQR
jgi:hypothetical protein